MTHNILTILFIAALVPGLLISFVPGLPAMIYMLSVAAVYGIIDRFTTLSYTEMGILGAVAFAAILIDFISGAIGAKWGGAHLSSIFAGFAGMVTGTFFIPIPIFGSIVGLVGGIFIAEYARKKNLRAAERAAIGGLIGAIFGTTGNVIASIAFLVLFIVFVFN